MNFSLESVVSPPHDNSTTAAPLPVESESGTTSVAHRGSAMNLNLAERLEGELIYTPAQDCKCHRKQRPGHAHNDTVIRGVYEALPGSRCGSGSRRRSRGNGSFHSTAAVQH